MSTTTSDSRSYPRLLREENPPSPTRLKRTRARTVSNARLVPHNPSRVRELRRCRCPGLGSPPGSGRATRGLRTAPRAGVDIWTTLSGSSTCLSRLHSRYTRTEILAAFAVGEGAKPPTWQTGVWWEPQSRTDLFAFTLDKSVGGFSPTTRYRDYAISPELIHWESQSATASDSPTGRRYIHQRRARNECRAFCAAANNRACLLVPRPGDLREPRRRPSDRVRVEAAATPPSRSSRTSFAAAVA